MITRRILPIRERFVFYRIVNLSQVACPARYTSPYSFRRISTSAIALHHLMRSSSVTFIVSPLSQPYALPLIIFAHQTRRSVGPTTTETNQKNHD